MSEQHLRLKIGQLEERFQERELKLKSQLRNCRQHNRRLRQRNKELCASRSHVREKYKSLQCQVQRAKCCSSISHDVRFNDGISGHRYGQSIVQLCLILYSIGGCSFRGVIRVLLCLQLELGLKNEDIPSKSSVSNWLSKLGYYTYTQRADSLYRGEYSLIVDESMVIGQERLFVVLGIEAEKKDKTALQMGAVRVLHLSVRPSWTHQDFAEVLKKVTEKMGKSPSYVISDGASSLVKGIKTAGMNRICDIGHEIGKYLEQTYRDMAQYKAFTSAAAHIKFKEVMKPSAYLLPPKQRSIARFMNMSGVVDWAKKLLAIFHKLTPNEQQIFGWLKDFKELIAELSHVFDLANQVMKIVKNQGISNKTMQECLELTKPYGQKVPQKIIEKIKLYCKNEMEKLPKPDTCWHASSDIIESLFGKYKDRMACNKLNGVTPLVLSLCVVTQFSQQEDWDKQIIKNALQEVSMTDLDKWKDEYLIDNQVVRRHKVLKK